ncbi:MULTISPECIES: hypothetical protein [Pseudomonas]|uniref:Uncharacterized protein n=1 Tax=Pseudomonas quercus TaxID=2722792 RepID=A0ABX0YKH8_9PSED|nr:MULTISPECIES: hypothetical protein [Pseudomonas]MBF7144274.1 hypothetical protein [Pseudomonas sp. LY10J]NJP02814.1 hypothetical protein [Pseudomonas quercus]
MNTIQIGLASGLVLGLLITVCCAIAFIANKYIETIEARLSNCPYVNDTKKIWGHVGLLGKIMRGGIIATILMMPNIHAKRGLIDSAEVGNLPLFYKKLLIAPIIVGSLLIFCLILLRIAAHFLN